MHDFLIAFAYIAMVLSPCFVAHWGDALSFERLFLLFKPARQLSMEPVLVAMRREYAAMQARQEEPVYANVVASWPPPVFAGHPSARKAMPKNEGLMRPGTIAFAHAQQRVAARLAQYAEAHRLAVAAEAAELAAALNIPEPVLVTAEPMLAEAALVEATAPQLSNTPSVAQLEALYALELPEGATQPRRRSRLAGSHRGFDRNLDAGFGPELNSGPPSGIYHGSPGRRVPALLSNAT